MWRRVVHVFFCIFLSTSSLNAATISGLVSDISGAIVPGARVVMRGVANGEESVVETGPDGRFQFDVTVPGTYLVMFTRTGFSQAAELCRCADHGLEVAAEAPLAFSKGVVTLATSGAFTRGTITKGLNPLNNQPLDGSPADSITPVRVLASARFTEPRNRWWAEYGVRTQTDVKRVTPTLLTSPFRVAPDFLSLNGFTVQRIGWGLNFERERQRFGLTFAVENLTNAFYREHFQFAPARGRSFTAGINMGAF